MTDTVLPMGTQDELTQRKNRLKRLEELQRLAASAPEDSLSRLSQDPFERRAIEEEIRMLRAEDEQQPNKPENGYYNAMANLFANHEDLPRKVDTPTRPSSSSGEPSNASSQANVDQDEQARLAAENERRLKEFQEGRLKESDYVKVDEEDLTNFFDWCLGGNRFLGYDEGKGDENTNRMASQLTNAIFTRLGGTGIGMALISTGALAWLGIIIIAWSNTPNCVMDKFKEALTDSIFGIIPFDKIPNITDKIEDYAEKTTAEKAAEKDRIEKGQKRREEILASQASPKIPEKIPTVSKPIPSKQSVNAQSVQPKTASEQTAPMSSIQSSEKPTPTAAPQKPIPNDGASGSVAADKNGTTQDAPQKPSSSSRQENSPVAGNTPRFTKTIPPVDPVRKHLSPESISNDGQNACMAH